MDISKMGLDELAEKVRFGEGDKPNKYGETEKMRKIWSVAETPDGDIKDIKFDMNEYDVAYFKRCREDYLFHKELKGEEPVIVHYFND